MARGNNVLRKRVKSTGGITKGESGVDILGSEGCTLAPGQTNVGCINMPPKGSEGCTLIPVASCQPRELSDMGSVAGTAGSSVVDQEDGEWCLPAVLLDRNGHRPKFQETVQPFSAFVVRVLTRREIANSAEAQEALRK